MIYSTISDTIYIDMSFSIQKLKRKLNERKRRIAQNIDVSDKHGFILNEESKVLRRSHIELIQEVLSWIKELEKENK